MWQFEPLVASIERRDEGTRILFQSALQKLGEVLAGQRGVHQPEERFRSLDGRQQLVRAAVSGHRCAERGVRRRELHRTLGQDRDRERHVPFILSDGGGGRNQARGL